MRTLKKLFTNVFCSVNIAKYKAGDFMLDREMEIKLLKLLFDYSIKGKLVDKKYIESFIDIVVNAKRLSDYVTRIEVLKESNISKTISAEYYQSSKKIFVYKQGIVFLLSKREKYRVIFSDIEKVFYQNVIISQVILHELEHANQERIISKEKSLEANILKFSDTDYIGESMVIKGLIDLGYSEEQIKKYILSLIESYKKIYRIYYHLAPNERFAEIKSLDTMIRILDLIRKYTAKLCDFLFVCQLENMVRGYDFSESSISSPTIDFIALLGRRRELNQFYWYNADLEKSLLLSQEQFSLTERMMYGLPIDSDEYDSVDKIIKMSDKYKI